MDTEAFETPDTEGPELGRINTTYLMILSGDIYDQMFSGGDILAFW